MVVLRKILVWLPSRRHSCMGSYVRMVSSIEISTGEAAHFKQFHSLLYLDGASARYFGDVQLASPLVCSADGDATASTVKEPWPQWFGRRCLVQFCRSRDRYPYSFVYRKTPLL